MKRISPLFFLFITFSLGTLSFAYGDTDSTIDSLLKRLPGMKDDTSKVNLLLELSDESGDYNETKQYAEKALSLARTIHYKKGISHALNNLGYVHNKQGNISKAFEYYHQTLKINEEIGDRDGVADAYNNLGYVYKKQNNYAKALEFFNLSLKIKEELGNKQSIATTLNNIGAIYLEENNNKEALEIYSRALMFNKEIGSKRGMAFSYTNIGFIYDLEGDFIKALEFYFKSLELFKQIKFHDGVAASSINIGSTYGKMHQFSNAEKYCKDALRISTEMGYPERIRYAALNLYKIFKKQNKSKDALKMHELYIVMRDSINNIQTQKASLEAEMKFNYEKKEALAQAEQQKKEELHKAALAQQILQRNASIAGLALMIMLAGVSYRNYRNKRKAHALIERQKAEVEHQKAIVEEKNKDILDSINYAKRIQEALLKEEGYVSDHLPDHFILFQPKDIVSGDFYWTFEKHGHLYCAAADCTGHGVPGAFMSMLGIAFLNEITATEELLSTNAILDKLRHKIIRELNQTGREGESKDGMDISLIRLNLETRSLQWSGANNPLWLIKSTGDFQEIKADKQPIGYHTHQAPFTLHHLELNSEDSFYLFTDGYADQFGGEKGKKFKYSQLKELLISINPHPMPDRKRILSESFFAWKKDLEQVDDVCVIGFKV